MSGADALPFPDDLPGDATSLQADATSSTGVDTEKATAASVLTSFQASWKGAAADVAYTEVGAIRTFATTLSNGFDDAAAQLGKYATALTTARTAIAGLQRLYDEAVADYATNQTEARQTHVDDPRLLRMVLMELAESHQSVLSGLYVDHDVELEDLDTEARTISAALVEIGGRISADPESQNPELVRTGALARLPFMAVPGEVSVVPTPNGVIVTGTDGDDRVTVERDPETGEYYVVVNGERFVLTPEQAQGMIIRTGDGTDVVDVDPNVQQGVTVSGGDGRDYVDTGDGNDTVDGGEDDDVVYGGRGDDDISGGEGRDYIDTGSGNDRTDGGTGDDMVSGGEGDDVVLGGEGDDVVYTGPGDDYANGGEGQDNVYAEHDDNVSTDSEDLVVRQDVDMSLVDSIDIDSDDPEFIERVRSDLVTLASSPTGAEMLAELRDEGITISEEPPDDGAVGNYGDGTVRYNTTAMANSGGDRPPIATLYHELAHAYNDKVGEVVDGVYTGVENQDQLPGGTEMVDTDGDGRGDSRLDEDGDGTIEANELDRDGDGEVDDDDFDMDINGDGNVDGDDGWTNNTEMQTVGLDVDHDGDPSTSDVNPPTNTTTRTPSTRTASAKNCAGQTVRCTSGRRSPGRGRRSPARDRRRDRVADVVRRRGGSHDDRSREERLDAGGYDASNTDGCPNDRNDSDHQC